MRTSFPKFSKKEYERRSNALKELMASSSVDFAIISGGRGEGANLYYWTHYNASSRSYFLTADGEIGALLVGHYNHIPTAKEMSVVETIEWATHAHSNKIVESTARMLRNKKVKKIGFIGNPPFEAVDRLRTKLDCSVVNLTRQASEIRALKSAEEIAWLEKGARLTDMAAKALEEDLKPGMTEFDVSNIIESSFTKVGGTTRIHYFGSTPMKHPGIFVPAQHQFGRKLTRGDIILTEISAEYYGYAGQLHRPITIVDNPAREYAKLYDVAVDAYERVFQILRDGVTSREITAAADEAIAKRGYTICDSLAHGFGADLMHPDVGTSNSVYEETGYVFRENMAVVIQPNPITEDERYGLQLGNLCIVGKKKSRCLQMFPMKFITVS
ncbi:MAG: M24 family metallopeptidase [Thaumarchaeota archaeon]|nr:M24 family metallopeptidase [Nitrososphaerota archaeon]